jgi:hypothetical protein
MTSSIAEILFDLLGEQRRKCVARPERLERTTLSSARRKKGKE